MVFFNKQKTDLTKSEEKPVQGLETAVTPELVEALIDSRGLLQDLLDTAVDLAFEVDSAGRFTYVFPQNFNGEDTLSWIGEKASLILWQRGEHPSRNPFNAKRTQTFPGVKITLYPDDLYFDFHIRPVVDQDGASTGKLRGTAKNVTEMVRKQRTQRLNALSQATEARLTEILMDAKDPGDLLDRAAQSMMDSFRADSVKIISEMGRDYVVLSSVGETPFSTPGSDELALMEDSLRKILIDGHEAMVLPLTPSHGKKGAAVLQRDTEISPWSAEEESVLSFISSMLSVAYEKAQLIEQLTDLANLDGLTGMLNRRAFEDRVNRRLSQPIPTACALVFIDLDNFKEVNDTLGHQAGDDALKLVGEHLKKTIRPRDLAGRFGGDEFVLWLEAADEETAAEKGQSLINEMMAIRSKLGNDKLGLSASVGICRVDENNTSSLSELAERADAALYDVKHAGKSGIAFASDALDQQNPEKG